MRKWKRVETADGPRFRSALEPHEAALLQNLATSMVGMLEERESSAPADELEQITGMRTGHSSPPEDETLKRLLPDFFRPQTDHPAGSGTAASLNSGLRSLHEPEIIEAKRQAAQRVLATVPETGGKFELTEDDAHAWAAAVNDMRLALGTMLGVTAEGPQELPPDHPMAGHWDVYQWLTVLQEYLVLGMMGKSGW
ncbi:oxidative stress transcriptional regulator AosR [Mycolicibacterium sp. XJ1819]